MKLKLLYEGWLEDLGIKNPYENESKNEIIHWMTTNGHAKDKATAIKKLSKKEWQLRLNPESQPTSGPWIEYWGNSDAKYWLSWDCYAAEKAHTRIKSGGENLNDITGYPEHFPEEHKGPARIQRIKQDIELIKDTLRYLHDPKEIFEDFKQHLKDNTNKETLRMQDPHFDKKAFLQLIKKEATGIKNLLDDLNKDGFNDIYT